MRYRSVVPLGKAPDAAPEPRVRYYSLSPSAKRLCNELGIWGGETMNEVQKRIEEHLKLLNDAQRRKLLLQIQELFHGSR